MILRATMSLSSSGDDDMLNVGVDETVNDRVVVVVGVGMTTNPHVTEDVHRSTTNIIMVLTTQTFIMVYNFSFPITTLFFFFQICFVCGTNAPGERGDDVITSQRPSHLQRWHQRVRYPSDAKTSNDNIADLDRGLR
jgi:hypothetical protein